MSSHTIPKMSLVAQYDDLCRYTKVLTTGCEEEFKIFVDGQKKLMRRWKEDKTEIEKLKEKVNSLEAEKKKLELSMKHTKKMIEIEVIKRRQLEMEKNSMERQIALIKEVLLADGTAIDNRTKEKLFILSNTTSKQPSESHVKLTTIEESMGSLLSPSDIDDTDEDLDMDTTRNRKRRSKSNRRSYEGRMQKRKKSSEQIVTTDFQSEDTDEAFRIDVDPMNAKNMRSSSEPINTSPDMPKPKPVHRSDSDQVKGRTNDFRYNSTTTLNRGTPVGRYSTGGKLSRTHAFVSKTVIRTEKCYPCGLNIKFCKQALRCSDCRVTCHPECKDQCPLPCIPVTYTPTKGTVGTIADYVSTTPPMIPSLIVHCVNEIESRGLRDLGLYRISGSEREVKDLKEKLLKRHMVSLNHIDVHVLCGTIKDFLRSLKDSLVTRALWNTFVNAAEERNDTVSLNLLYDVICDLPQPNKETLAFLILHLQRVADSPDCKMPVENLAKVFGPTIIGYSNSNPADSNMLTETRQQCLVMQRLLKIPSDSWQNLLNVEIPEVFLQNNTPEISPAPCMSRLGPIYASGQTPKHVQIGRTPLTPRNAKSHTKPGKRQFFTSPLLK